jgi:calcineurin-like phosphoesterase family protein
MSDRKIYVISDTHFNHENILKFTGDDGKYFRKFSDVHDMNEYIIDRWNKIVRPQDIIYHLGDVYFGHEKAAAEILGRLNGRKRLILGNHDNPKAKPLYNAFQKIHMWRYFPEYKALLTHVPVHPSAIRGSDINVHGHTHEKGSPEGPYKSVCVELTDYMPVELASLNP